MITMGDPEGIRIGDMVKMISTYENAKKGMIVRVTQIDMGGRGREDCGLQLSTLDGRWKGSPCNYRWEKVNNVGCRHQCSNCEKKCAFWESK